MIIDVVRLASKNRMTLTRQIRHMMDLEVGDVLAFVDFEDHVGVIKVNEENLLKDIRYYNNGYSVAGDDK